MEDGLKSDAQSALEAARGGQDDREDRLRRDGQAALEAALGVDDDIKQQPSAHVKTQAALSPSSNRVADSFESINAESRRKATIVQGLADAAKAIIATNPVAAAGLAMAAAHVAEAMPTGSGPGAAPNQVASGFASSALEAAKAGSETAAGLTEAAISTAVDVSRGRSRSAAEIKSLQMIGKVQPPAVTNASYSQILASMFKGGF